MSKYSVLCRGVVYWKWKPRVYNDICLITLEPGVIYSTGEWGIHPLTLHSNMGYLSMTNIRQECIYKWKPMLFINFIQFPVKPQLIQCLLLTSILNHKLSWQAKKALYILITIYIYGWQYLIQQGPVYEIRQWAIWLYDSKPIKKFKNQPVIYM